MTDDRAQKLRSVPLFSELSDEAIARVLDHAADFEVHSGHVLIEPGQPGAGLFVIEEGSALVQLKGNEIELGEGEFFGELALLDEEAVHTGRVCASSRLRGIAISRSDFAQLLDSEPTIARSMLRVLARRLARTTV